MGRDAQSFFLGPISGQWDLQQVGPQLTLTITYTGPPLFGTEGPYSGTIDPDTGVFHFDLPDVIQPPPLPPVSCGDSRIDGVVAADGTTMSGAYTAFFFKSTPPLVGCNEGGGLFTGARCAPGVPGCCTPDGSCCGNGLVTGSEQCDDGNQYDGDCCSATCQLEPAGTPCDDGNACTLGEGCTGTGFCLGGTTVTCDTCEVCDRDAGCVDGPQSPFACDAGASSALALSVAKPASPTVSWRRNDDVGVLFGDPTAGTEYDLCIFDAAGLVVGATAPPGGTCDGKPCWRSTASGFRYRERTGASDGLRQIDLRRTASGFRLKLNAKGPNVHLPVSLTAVAAPVVAELQAHDTTGNACWQSTFNEGAIERTAKTLKARD